MNSDYDTRPATPQFVHAGTGMYMTFNCAKCKLPKQTAGRRKKPVFGRLKDWVCAGCATDMEAKV